MGKGFVDKLKEEFDIEDEWLPFEIHPETPLPGISMEEKFPGASMERMFSNLRRMGSPLGIEFAELKFVSNSHLALRVGEYAKEKGKGHDFDKRVFSAFFTEGRDIGNQEVILSVAEAVGLNTEELLKRLEEGAYEETLRNTQKDAHRYGISSAPTFIIDGKQAIVGAQPVEAFKQVLVDLEEGSK